MANKKEIELVLCPIRGGKRSERTVERAVELAREGGAKLLFLYIVDVDFLGYATVARVKIMVDELMETGYFAMSILCDKAKARGVADARAVIREGALQDVIVSVVKEMGATHLVIGRPVINPGVKSFSANSFKRFIQSLKDLTGIEVESVE